jgi:hypothetical protein
MKIPRKTLIWIGVIAVFLAAGGVYYAQTQQFTDSNIVVVKTQSEAVTIPYVLYCVPVSNSDISVSWSGNISAQHNLKLYASQEQSLGDNIYNTTGASGSYTQIGLSAGTTMYYTLRTVYADGTTPSVDSAQVACSTFGPAVGDESSNIGVFARDDSIIFVNWKDNVSSTQPYNFEIQRIKVTPSLPENLRITSAGSQKISLAWDVNTTSTPFYTVIERSSDNINFNVVSARAGQTDPKKALASSFSYDDTNGIQSGSVYYYRVKACSSVPIGSYYTKAQNTNTYLNENKTDPACSEYTNPVNDQAARMSAGEKIVGYAQGIFESIFGGSGAKLAEGQAASGVNFDSYFSDTSFSSSSTKPYYLDADTSAQSVYLYRVRVVYTNGEKSGWSSMGAGKTLKDIGTDPADAFVCTANSFCDRTLEGNYSSDRSERSEKQCLVNADCRNVGRSSRTFIEQ